MTYYYGHFTLAEGVPAGDGSWGSPGDVAAEEGMGSKPAECPLSPEKAVMACSLAETLGLPERITTLGTFHCQLLVQPMVEVLCYGGS